MDRSEPHRSEPHHWFEPVADRLGRAYLRYSFTKGTQQEVDALVEHLRLRPGQRVLDLGCGPGRHALELARRGIAVVGLDIADTFLRVAASQRSADQPVGFVRGDARALPFAARFDAAISLCQGGFGLLGGPAGDASGNDEAVLRGLAGVVRPGGRLALTAFSAYFLLTNGVPGTFDAATGTHHEHTEVRDESGAVHPAELWTTCYTPRELRLLAAATGWRVDHLWAVEPGDYGARDPDMDHPEFLLLCTRLGGSLETR